MKTGRLSAALWGCETWIEHRKQDLGRFAWGSIPNEWGRISKWKTSQQWKQVNNSRDKNSVY